MNGKVQFLSPEQAGRCIALLWQANVTTCLVGDVGVGKTSAVKDFVKKLGDGWGLWPLPAPYLNVEDLSGIPYPDSSGTTIKYLATPLLPFGDEQAKGVVLIDEIDRAEPAVQNAASLLILEREVHGHRLPDNVYIVAAMNSTSDIHTTPLSRALLTRVCTLFVSSTADEFGDSYDDWAEENGISPAMRSFARYRSDLLHTFDEFEEMSIARPRTRDMVDRVCSAAERVTFKTEDILLPCLAGLVGKAVAIEFMAFRALCQQTPTPGESLADPAGTPVPDRLDVCYHVALTVFNSIGPNPHKAAKFFNYATRMPAEICAFVARKLADLVPPIVGNPLYIHWVNKHGELLT